MKKLCLLRASVALVLGLVLAIPAFPQIGSGLGNIGPSKGEVIAIIAGTAVVIGGVVYLVYHETHKHPSITGCVAAGAGGLTLTNPKDKKVYALSGDLSAVKEGEQITVKGKKSKDSSGKAQFQVEKVSKDLGVCRP